MSAPDYFKLRTELGWWLASIGDEHPAPIGKPAGTWFYSIGFANKEKGAKIFTAGEARRVIGIFSNMAMRMETVPATFDDWITQPLSESTK